MEKIKLIRLKLQNFRNITDAEYHFADRSAISGQNFIGKSNSIEALTWLLTDKLMNGDYDPASLKPLSNKKAEVVVEAEFLIDGKPFIVSKLFREHWTKTRGTEEVTLTGHDTIYTVDGIKMERINDAVAKISEKLKIRANLGRFEFMRALTNPLYYEQIPWKDLLEFVSSIVPMVKEEDIYKNAPIAEIARSTIERFGGNTNDAMKYLKQQRDNAKLTKTDLESAIHTLAETKDVDETTLKNAQVALEELDEKIAQTRVASNEDSPAIRDAEEEIKKLSDQIKDMEFKAQKDLNNANNVIYAGMNDYKKAEREAYGRATVALQNITTHKASISIKENDIKNMTDTLNRKLGERQESLDKYNALKVTVYVAPDESKCPQCGFVLNASDIDAAKKQFDIDKAKKIDENIRFGTALKVEIDNLKLKIEETTKKIAEEKEVVKALEIEQASYEAKYNELEEKIKVEDAKIQRQVVKSEKVIELEGLLSVKQVGLYQLRNAQNDQSTKDATINAYKAQKAQFKETTDAHAAYLANQRSLKEKQASLTIATKSLSENEDRIIGLEKYLEAKLALLNANLATVFGEVKFVLAELNIKEGSWNQVCYPLIKGKSVPFYHGSTSEKIITGISITESIKNAMRNHADEKLRADLPDLPILFDEGEALDSETIATRLATRSQIITAAVNDNYAIPTVVDLTTKEKVI